MESRTLRPSMKMVWATYLLAAIVFCAAAWALYHYQYAAATRRWMYAIPLIVFFPPLRMHIRRLLVTLRLDGDHLTLESGFFSRTRRTLDMAKIQDVTVRQSFGQRLLGTGDLSLETAGEGGGLGVRNIDSPRAVADQIIATSKRAADARAHGLP